VRVPGEYRVEGGHVLPNLLSLDTTGIGHLRYNLPGLVESDDTIEPFLDSIGPLQVYLSQLDRRANDLFYTILAQPNGGM